MHRTDGRRNGGEDRLFHRCPRDLRHDQRDRPRGGGLARRASREVGGALGGLEALVSGARVALVESAIDVGAVTAAVQRPESGGLAVFVGTVRSESEGRAVTLLEYEAYRAMAVA